MDSAGCGAPGASAGGSCRQGGQGARALETLCSGAGSRLRTAAAGPPGSRSQPAPQAARLWAAGCEATLLDPEHWTGSPAAQAVHQLRALGHPSSLRLPSPPPLPQPRPSFTPGNGARCRACLRFRRPPLEPSSMLSRYRQGEVRGQSQGPRPHPRGAEAVGEGGLQPQRPELLTSPLPLTNGLVSPLHAAFPFSLLLGPVAGGRGHGSGSGPGHPGQALISQPSTGGPAW